MHAERMTGFQKLRVPQGVGPVVCGDALILPKAVPAMRYPAWPSDILQRRDRRVAWGAPAQIVNASLDKPYGRTAYGFTIPASTLPLGGDRPPALGRTQRLGQTQWQRELSISSPPPASNAHNDLR